MLRRYVSTTDMLTCYSSIVVLTNIHSTLFHSVLYQNFWMTQMNVQFTFFFNVRMKFVYQILHSLQIWAFKQIIACVSLFPFSISFLYVAPSLSNFRILPNYILDEPVSVCMFVLIHRMDSFTNQMTFLVLCTLQDYFHMR